MDLTLLEFILSGMVIIAAGVSYYLGHDEGIGNGMDATLEIMIKEGIVSRFVTKEGDLDICSAGVMTNICPKCGFKDGEICGEHTQV